MNQMKRNEAVLITLALLGGMLGSPAFANTGIEIGGASSALTAQDPWGNSYQMHPVKIVRALRADGRVAEAGEPASAVEVEPLNTSDVADAEGDAGSGVGVRGVFTVQLSYPQIVSASVGIIIGSDRTPEVMSGVLLQVEAGLNGFGGSVGWGIKGDMVLGGLSINGINVKVSGLYTYNVTGAKNPLLGIQPGTVYVGPELDVVMGFVKLTIGALYAVAKDDASARDWLITGGFGVQF